MKSVFIALLAVFVVSLCAHTAHAQPRWGEPLAEETRPWKVYTSAGLGSPRGRFGNMYDMGMHLGAAMGHALAEDVSIRINMEYHRFGVDKAIAMQFYRRQVGAGSRDLDLSGGSMNVIMFGANVKYDFRSPPSRLVPFIGAGLGIGVTNVGNVTLTASGRTYEISPDGDSDFYFEAGGGLEIDLTPRFAMFVQARYVGIHSEGDPITFLPLSFGVRF